MNSSWLRLFFVPAVITVAFVRCSPLSPSISKAIPTVGSISQDQKKTGDVLISQVHVLLHQTRVVDEDGFVQALAAMDPLYERAAVTLTPGSSALDDFLNKGTADFSWSCPNT